MSIPLIDLRELMPDAKKIYIRKILIQKALIKYFGIEEVIL